MKVRLVIAIISLSGQLFAQGIDFKKPAGFIDLKKKAETEDKFIFLDLYATWCVPCKEMDDKIFSTKKVGDFFNKNFISSRIQMDKLKGDLDYIRSWYKVADSVNKEFEVSAFPTLIILNSQGELAHKMVGWRNSEDLIREAKSVIGEGKGYYLLKRRYDKGDRDPIFVRFLARKARELDLKNQADSIAESYINSLTDKELYDEDNVQFLGDFTRKSNARGFEVFFKHWNNVKQYIANQNFRRELLRGIIIDEEIRPYEQELNGFLDWSKIESNLKKYGVDGRIVYLWHKSSILQRESKWKELSIVVNELLTRDAESFSNNELNDMSWAIFDNCNDKEVLHSALKWMEKLVLLKDVTGGQIDTYANLLYKIGDTEKAKIWQKKAISSDSQDSELKEHYQKMLKGDKTWN